MKEKSFIIPNVTFAMLPLKKKQYLTCINIMFVNINVKNVALKSKEMF